VSKTNKKPEDASEAVKPGLVVRTRVRAGKADEGYESQQHSQALTVRTRIRAGRNGGYQSQQHSQTVARLG
jgi:hypothetical protein